MRDLKKWILNDLMNEEAEEQLNASRYERNNNRKDYRNGYKQRSLLTTDGKVILDKHSSGKHLSIQLYLTIIQG